MSFIYTPRTGKEMLGACPPDTRLIKYSTLSSSCSTPEQVLERLGDNNLILIQNPHNMNSGHWVSLSFNRDKNEAYYFSSYGMMPDVEKLKWIPRTALVSSGQEYNILNETLKYLNALGWKIYYNDYPYQIAGDRTATCGIWTSAFLNSKLNPDEFAKSHKNVYEYFHQYFE